MQEGLYQPFTAVADATELPVMVYDVFGRTGVRVSPETWLRVARHPRFVAAKVATGLAWHSGDDVLLLPLVSVGATGVVAVATHVAGAQAVMAKAAAGLIAGSASRDSAVLAAGC